MFNAYVPDLYQMRDYVVYVSLGLVLVYLLWYRLFR